MRRPPPQAPARSRAAMMLSISSWWFPFFFLLDTEIGVELVHVGLQLGIGETVDDLAVLDDVVAVRHRRRETEILLDQEDGESFLLEPRDGVPDLLDDDGRK